MWVGGWLCYCHVCLWPSLSSSEGVGLTGLQHCDCPRTLEKQNPSLCRWRHGCLAQGLSSTSAVSHVAEEQSGDAPFPHRDRLGGGEPLRLPLSHTTLCFLRFAPLPLAVGRFCSEMDKVALLLCSDPEARAALGSSPWQAEWAGKFPWVSPYPLEADGFA